MAIYEVSNRTVVVTATAGTVIAALRSGASRRALLKEVHIFSVTAPTTVGELGLVRATVLSTTPTSPIAGLPRNPVDVAAATAMAVGWTTPPAVSGFATKCLRRFSCGPSVGNGVIWQFLDDEGGLILPANVADGEICIVNLQSLAPGTWDITCVFEE
jgi:hypothetical protein